MSASYAETRMNIKPLSGHVVVEPRSREEKTESGIILPPSSDRERPEQGTVIAVGRPKRTEKGEEIPMEVKEGDRVLFSKYAPTEFKVKDKEYLIARQEDILAILED